MQDSYISKLRSMGYRIIGENKHSAVKACHWTKQSLSKNRFCYKQKFYGIQSHRCLQMTPCIDCEQRCVFCWRPYSFEAGEPQIVWDSPETIVEESIDAQRKLLEGYNGMPGVDRKKLEEANNPNQVAISLAGEPTMYPYLSSLVEAYGKRGFTTFVVSNGLHPEVLGEMKLPTQLYISLDAPNENLHKKINIPLISNSWQKLNESLELLSSLNTRTCIRITAVKDWNMSEPENYAKLVEKSGADFVEVKSYMLVGASRNRLTIDNMPSHAETKQFCFDIAAHLPTYTLVDEKEDSRVALLSSGKTEQQIKQ